MRQVIWATPSKVDLAALFDPHVTARPEFIFNALTKIAHIERLLADNPALGAPLENSAWRKIRIGRTPLNLVYRYDDQSVTILRAHHAASDWRK